IREMTPAATEPNVSFKRGTGFR
ncbi:unnamed protein product, partial [Rotaria magnacalcarata]